MKEDTTMVLPWRKLGIATLIVAMKMNRISCAVERKTAGRALGLEDSSSGIIVAKLPLLPAGWSTKAINVMSRNFSKRRFNGYGYGASSSYSPACRLGFQVRGWVTKFPADWLVGPRKQACKEIWHPRGRVIRDLICSPRRLRCLCATK